MSTVEKIQLIKELKSEMRGIVIREQNGKDFIKKTYLRDRITALELKK